MTATDSATRPNIDTAALAQRLGLSVSAIVSRRHQGRDLPPSFKVGRNIRYRLEDVERWEREQVEKETARRAAAAQQQTATA